METDRSRRRASSPRTLSNQGLFAVVALAALALCACASNSSGHATTVMSVPQSNIVVLTNPPVSGTGGTTAGPGATSGGNPVTAPPVTLPPPTTTPSVSTAPADGPIVTIIQGAFNTKASGSCGIGMCKYVDIQMSGFAKGETLSITCYSNHGSSGPYTKTADKTGSYHSSTACFFGNVTNVYVTVNGVSSNVVTPWKDW